MTHHRTNRWRIIRLCLLLLILSPFLLLGAVHVWAHVRVQAQVRAIRTTGDPVTLEDLDALARQVALQEDAAVFYREIFAGLAFDEMDKGLRSQLPSVWRIESGKQAWPLPEEDRQWVEDILEADKETLALLKEAPEIHGRVYDVSFVDWQETFSSRVEQLQQVGDLLVLQAIYAANQADITTVVESLELVLRVAETLREERFSFSQGNRRYLIDQAARTLGWASGVLPFAKDQQQRLDRQLQGIQWPMSLRSRLVDERCVFRSLYHNTTPEMLKGFGISLKRDKPIPSGWIAALKWSGLLRHSEASFLAQSEQVISESLGWKPGANMDRLRRQFSSIDGPLPLTLGPMFLEYAEWECLWPYRARARLQVLRCALAARQYQQQTDQWPQNLEELAPDYLSAVPSDPYIPAPIQYQLRQGGRAVFSVGGDLHSSQEPYFRDYRNQQTCDDIIIWLEAPEENPENPHRKIR